MGPDDPAGAGPVVCAGFATGVEGRPGTRHLRIPGIGPSPDAPPPDDAEVRSTGPYRVSCEYTVCERHPGTVVDSGEPAPDEVRRPSIVGDRSCEVHLGLPGGVPEEDVRGAVEGQAP